MATLEDMKARIEDFERSAIAAPDDDQREAFLTVAQVYRDLVAHLEARMRHFAAPANEGRYD